MFGLQDEGPEKIRKDYIFALSLRDPSSIELGPPGAVKLRNRLLNKEGYVGNYGICVRADNTSVHLLPEKGKVYKHPTFAQMDEVNAKAYIFYELHPQLWGKGLMSEVFVEGMRYCIEEIGVPVVVVTSVIC